MKIALVTYQDNGKYHLINVANEDDTLLEFLKSKGYVITKEIWNDTEVKWEEYDIVILKSPWDYFDLIEDFYTWLAKLENKNVRSVSYTHLDVYKRQSQYQAIQIVTNPQNGNLN